MGDVTVPNVGDVGSGSPQQPAQNPGQWPTDPWPLHWDLLNQNWTVQLVPATTENLAEILQTNPPAGALTSSQAIQVRVPRLGSATSKQIRQINTH